MPALTTELSGEAPMATAKLQPLQYFPNCSLVLRERRVFRCVYLCRSCDVRFADEMLTASHSWCPECETRVEPYLVEEFLETRPEFDEEDA